MQDIEITTTDVAKALNKLNTFISWSPDNRLAYFLKQVWFYVDTYNEYFFNLALHQGVIPNKWKRAIISPIYKRQWLFCRRRQFALGIYFAVITHVCLYSQIGYNYASDTAV